MAIACSFAFLLEIWSMRIADMLAATKIPMSPTEMRASASVNAAPPPALPDPARARPEPSGPWRMPVRLLQRWRLENFTSHLYRPICRRTLGDGGNGEEADQNHAAARIAEKRFPIVGAVCLALSGRPAPSGRRRSSCACSNQPRRKLDCTGDKRVIAGGNGYLLHVNPVRYDAALLPHQTRREQTGNFDFGLYTPAHREVGLPRGHWTDTIGGMENDATRLARILVLYFSRDGHTKSMAELVAEGASSVPMTELRLKTVAQASAEDLIWCDGIAAGAPTHMGTIPWEMKQWWDVTAQPLWPKVDGKIGCAFTSSGGLAGGGELTCLALQIVMMNYGMLVFGVPDYVAPGQTRHNGAFVPARHNPERQRPASRNSSSQFAMPDRSVRLRRQVRRRR